MKTSVCKEKFAIKYLCENEKKKLAKPFLPILNSSFMRSSGKNWVSASVVDPDPDWIRTQELPGSGSGSVLGIRIRIQIHTFKYSIR